jgi:HEAT repeats
MRNSPLLGLILLSSVTASAFAQPPLRNANLVRHPGSTGLSAIIAAIAPASEPPAWVAWAVPAFGGFEACCCSTGSDEHCGSSRLDDEDNSTTNSRRMSPPRDGSALTVALRVRAGRPDRLRFFSDDCPVDAAGQTVHWIEPVSPSESVAYLAAAARSGADRVSKRAVAAIALHGDQAADRELEVLAGEGNSDELRGAALFWLAETRGRAGLAAAKRVLRSDAASLRLKDKAIFALYIVGDAAVDELIEVARRDAEPQVRRKALFWLAQRAGRKAAAALKDAVDSDPADEVKSQAVFGISQLPNDESIPLLAELARTNRSAAVRRKAIFWLGQKNDPRAVDAIADLLK